MRRRTHQLSLTLGLLTLTVMMSGCEVGRTWGSMSSDSPMPFFGVDLMPRRTSQLSFPKADPMHQLSSDAWRLPGNSAKNSIHPVVERKQKAKTGELRLMSVSDFSLKDEEVELSFKGPKSAFAR